MTKKQLIEALEKYPDDIKIAVYTNEEMGIANGLVLQERPNKNSDNQDGLLYTKADHPLDPTFGWVADDKILVIGSIWREFLDGKYSNLFKGEYLG